MNTRVIGLRVDQVAVAFEQYYPAPLKKWVNVHAYPSADGISVYFTDITERKEAEEELRRYAERLAMLHEMDRAILAARSSAQIAQSALERLGRIVPLWRSSVAMIDVAKNEAMIIAAIGGACDNFPVGTRLSMDRFSAPDLEALKAGREFVVNDLSTAPATPGTLLDLAVLGVRSYVRVPLTTEGQLLGSLNLYSDQPCCIRSRAPLTCAREAADSLAIAIRQAQLF